MLTQNERDGFSRNTKMGKLLQDYHADQEKGGFSGKVINLVLAQLVVSKSECT